MQPALCRNGGEGGYEQLSKKSFVVYLTAKKLAYLNFVVFEKTRPGFNQNFPIMCSVFSLHFGAEHYQSLEIAVTNVMEHYLREGISIPSSVITLHFNNKLCFEKQSMHIAFS
jgi:hypothetical protein